MKRTFIFLVALTIGIVLHAQTFTVDGIGYTITSDSTCGVYSCTTPVCNIPPSVSYDSVEYTVNAIYGEVRLSRIYSSSYYMGLGNGQWGYHNTGSTSMFGNGIIQSITIPYTIEHISFQALHNLSALTGAL